MESLKTSRRMEAGLRRGAVMAGKIHMGSYMTGQEERQRISGTARRKKGGARPAPPFCHVWAAS